MAMPGPERWLNVDLEWFSRLFRAHLAIDEWVLNTWVVLDKIILAQFEVEVLELVQCEWVVVPTVKIAHFRLLLCNLRCGPRAWVSIGSLQAKLPRVHVILFPTLDGCRR